MDTNPTLQSSNYDDFKFMTANREVYRGHVEKLKKAFEELGNLTQVQPILVNERMEIIDGQHRFTACKELNLPIFYTVAPGLGIEESRGMNILQRGWGAMDYARSYAATGNKHYIRYLELMEEYGLSHSIMLEYVLGQQDSGGERGNGALKAFREGDFVISDEKAAIERLNRLMDITEHLPSMRRHRVFARALLKVMRSEDYNHKRMVKKAELHGNRVVRKYASVEDNERMLEELYNYLQRERSRVRLF